MTAPAEKHCVLCGTDVSGAPRVKDAQGHYICRPCHDHHALRGAGGSANAPERQPAERVGDVSALEPIGLADDDAPPIALAPEVRLPRPCPSCHATMAAGDVVCVGCGFDARSRLKHATTAIVEGDDPAEARKPKRKFFEPGLCGYCGYALKGLASGKCPECGQLNSLSRQDDQLWKDSRQIARDTYKRAAFMFLGGFAAIAAIQLYRGNPLGIAWELAKWACEVPIGTGVFWLCCLTFLGFDAPMRLVALRLAGIYAITDAIYLLFAFQPVWIWSAGLAGLAYLYMLSEELELERADAASVGVLTFLAKMGVVIAVVLTFS